MNSQKFTDYEMFNYVKEKFRSVDVKYVYYSGAILVGTCLAFYVGDVLDHIPVLNTAATIIGTYHILKYAGRYVSNAGMDKMNKIIRDVFSIEAEVANTVQPEDEEDKKLNDKIRKYISKL